MSLYKELAYDNGDIDLVTGVQFCIMSPDDIRSRSAVEVSAQTYSHNEPVHGGLFDRRMGVVEPNVLCQTCEQRNNFCPGHFGHIELARPVFHAHFFEMVRRLLRCICFRCSRVPIILADMPEVRRISEAKRISRQKRWELIHKILQKIKKCPHCGMRQPDKCSRYGILRIELEWRSSASASSAVAAADEEPNSSNSNAANSSQYPANSKIILGADDVLRMFRRMTDEDITLLGFCKHQNRPEWMICTVLLVPPPSVRPTVKNEVGQRQEDDLTTKLMAIVKYNTLVKQKLDKGLKDQAEPLYKLLQYEVATLIDNNIPGIPPSSIMRTGRPIRALTERLKSKEGRIRGNLMGKRVDFSARSVITPDPNISIDELGVPIRIAMNLTIPEVVNVYTLVNLQAKVRAGSLVHPGAKFVCKINEGSRKVMLKGLPQDELNDIAEALIAGDTVERHLIDGDVVLFNRQPSLHKMSMMGHRVRVMPFNTFRLNVCVTPNFNADFDGDEMNMHVPQSMQTHEELAQLATVMNQIISPRECKPIISVVQDIALGIFRMTRDGSMVTPRQFMNLMASKSSFVPINRQKELTMGHDLLSTVIPSGVWTTCKGHRGQVNVIDGHIQPGSAKVTKNVYQEQSNGLVHAIHNVLGKEATRRFLDDTQKLVCDFLVLDGFSVGVSDLVVSESTRHDFRDVVKNMRKQVADIMRSVHEGTLENASNKSNHEHFETVVNNILNEARNKIGKLAIGEVSDKDNRLFSMVNAGSKGSEINVAQMMGCVGQVMVEAKRIPYGFENRTLPHYTRYDDGPEARGFVKNSFIGGLTPQEFFFHSMGGREGLIDTAVKSVTWETPIVITESGVPKYVRIGEWIDGHLDAAVAKERVRHFPEEKNMELLDLQEDVFIPTVDADGNVTWGKLTAVTRHDPGERLYKVTTEGGREVTVAESKSLLVWDATTEKFAEIMSDKVKVGDYMPVTMNLPAPPVVVSEVDMALYLPKTEYVYGTDFNTATRLVGTAAPTPPARLHRSECCLDDDIDDDDDVDVVESESIDDDVDVVESESIDDDVVESESIDDDSNESPHDRSMVEAQGDRFHIPRGWWEANNGTTFTLPYPKKSLLTRAMSGRSNVDNIRDGFVYPYGATRCHGHLPDTLVLNKENGIFLGLFLADGHACDKSGVVGITKNEKSVQDFTKAWFEKHGFKTRLQDNVNDLGSSSTMCGYSSLLARFLDAFVGHGSRNKYVPDVAFVAPEEFVIGLLNGYFSGDGHIDDRGSVTSSSASRRLTEGISMLCSRIGVFGKISTVSIKKNNIGTEDIASAHRYSVRAQWGSILASKLDLVHATKKETLESVKFTACHQNFEARIDTILDPIASISVIGVDGHPKLYDVTVPSTLNFGIANGLVCRDTSETGYIQRKLVKAMEDFKIHHDGTVRNAAGTIIQFLYGDEGMDPIKIERHKMPHLHFCPAEILETYGFTDAELADLGYDDAKKIKAVREVIDVHIQEIEDEKEFVIVKMFKGIIGEVEFPVNVQRLLVSNASSAKKTWASIHDPIKTIIDKIAALIAELRVNHANACPRIFSIILHAMLSPKAVTKMLRGMDVFDEILARIKREFKDAIADASEMVGVVAAQSISEPTTQLTLNTFHLSGVASASAQVRGVPRLKEIIDCTASKNIKTPVMKIFFQESMRANQAACIDVMNHLRMIRFRDVVSRSRIYFDPAETIGAPSHIEKDSLFVELYSRFDALVNKGEFSPWVLRLELDRQKMLDLSLTMIDIDRVLHEFYDEKVSVIFSDDNASEMAMRVRLLITSGEGDDLLTELKALEHNILDIVNIRGIEAVEKVRLSETLNKQRYSTKLHAFEPFSEFIIETDGSNLPDVMGVPGIDPYRTTTNDIYEVFHTLGVEAARQKLHDEIIEVLIQTYINYRHVALLVDAITNKGTLVSVNRHGINQGDNGPLAKCSFEETVVRLVNAGIFSERDRVNGVSANIMLGQVAPCGTGDSKILVDIERLPQALPPTVEEEKEEEDDDDGGLFDFDLKIA